MYISFGTVLFAFLLYGIYKCITEIQENHEKHKKDGSNEYFEP